MMLAGSLQSVAKVLKSNGSDGSLVLGIQLLTVQDFLSLTLEKKVPVFLYFEGLPVPFFISDAQEKGKSRLVVHMTGIRSLKDADEVAGSTVYMESSQLSELIEDEETGFSHLVGWSLFENDLRVGTVVSWEDIPGNPCLILDNGAVIPLHEDFIASVDGKNKSLHMNLPDGLLEVQDVADDKD